MSRTEDRIARLEARQAERVAILEAARAAVAELLDTRHDSDENFDRYMEARAVETTAHQLLNRTNISLTRAYNVYA